jgi:hypothetical protein
MVGRGAKRLEETRPPRSRTLTHSDEFAMNFGSEIRLELKMTPQSDFWCKAGRRIDVSNAAVAACLLFVLDALNVAGVLAFALAGSFAFALATFWLASSVRRLGEPLYLTWLNQGLDPRVRATVISMGS